MSKKHQLAEICLIPVDLIDVLNPRARNEKVFEKVIGSIQAIGLKKPIMVTPRTSPTGPRYLLVFGEGRLKAFKALGEPTIPAMVVEVSDEDGFIMSLVENIARRKHRTLELLAGIVALGEKGYDQKTIAAKTGLSVDYLQGILYLLQHGEERLLLGVDQGRIPLSTALSIVGAGDDDKTVQAALQDAYESGQLRSNRLIMARRLVERRRILGVSQARGSPRSKTPVSSVSLVRTYQREIARQTAIIKKAGLAQQRLLFVVEALRPLLADQNFVNLLRAERLDALPKCIADRVNAPGARG